MPSPLFHFKQFSIAQQSVGMKVNTDGVLLGAWTDVENAKQLLDVGAGTGVIALMLAQRNTTAKIDAVEIDELSAQQASENVKNSPFNDRIFVYHKSLQTFADECTKQYDLVVSNPPYFVDALLSPSAMRTQTRHTKDLSHEELINYTKKILTPTGALCVILPYTEGHQFIDLALKQHFFCHRKTTVYSTKNKSPKRLLLHFSLEHKPLIEEEFFIHDNNGEYSQAYKNLTRDFYLKF